MTHRPFTDDDAALLIDTATARRDDAARRTAHINDYIAKRDVWEFLTKKERDLIEAHARGLPQTIGEETVDHEHIEADQDD